MMCCQSIGKLPGTKVQQEAYMSLAKERLGDNSVYTPNKDKSFVLCVNEKEGTARLPNSTIKFFVYDLKGAQIPFEQSLNAGYVKWISTNEIEYYSTPGMMPQGTSRDDYTRIYNVVSGEVVLKSSIKNQ